MFVGNLAFQTTKEQIVDLLSAAGAIQDVYFPVDRNTGKPRGFAFVEFSNDQQAQDAIERFNDHELDGRKLRVNAAEERRSRPAPSFRGFQPDFGADLPSGRRAKPKGSRRGMRGRKRSL